MAHAGESRHVGRPRDPAIDRAVLDETLAVLHQHGYSGFSLEAVATRAGTTKPSIARRWRRRQELIIAALATALVRPPVPDTGCTRCDLMDSVELLADALLRRMPRGVLAPLIADCAPDPQLHSHLTDTLIQPMREAVTVSVRRGLQRGDIRADVDPELLVNVLASVVFQSCLFADPDFEVQHAAEVVDLVLRGAATDYDGLLAHSEAHAHEHIG